MSEGFYDTESQQMIVTQCSSKSILPFTTLKTIMVNYHKHLLILGFILIGTFIAVYHHNQIESESQEFDFSAFSLQSDDSMITRNLMSAASIITAATFNFGGPNASPFEYYPSTETEWYSTFSAINADIHRALWESDKAIADILPEDYRVKEMIANNTMVTMSIAEIMQYAQTTIDTPKELPYESRIFSVLGRLDRYTWLKQDAKYPTGDKCRKDLIENGVNWTNKDWNRKWDDTWKDLKNDDQDFASNKFLENSALSRLFEGKDKLKKKFAIVMLKTFDKICWDAVVKAMVSQSSDPVAKMFQTAFKGEDSITTHKIQLLQTVAKDHHVTFVHEGIDLEEKLPKEYHIVKSESKVNTPSLIIFNTQKFDHFQNDEVILQISSNEFVAVQYDNIIYASFHAASSPKAPNRAINKMEALEKYGFPIIAGMDCNEDIFEKGYSGTAYPEEGSMTTHKMRSDTQEQQGKANKQDSKQKDEIFYSKITFVKGWVLKVSNPQEMELVEINSDKKQEDIIPNSNMPLDHFIVSAEFTK